MENKYKFDVVIIGAGIIGLAIAERLRKSFKDVLVLEKEEKFGQHTSSRNSEVIHSGIYYPINSLKSKLCIRGNKLLYNFLKKHDIPYLNCGKLIIASNKDEEKILDKLFSNGMNKKINGLEYISSKKAKLIEPNVKCTKAIWVPSSGIMDSHRVMKRLEYNFISNDGVIVYNTLVNSIINNKSNFNIKTNNQDNIETKILINAAGLWADQISLMLGIDKLKIHYYKGEYYKTNRYKNINCLIYPLPSEVSLGIHAAIQLNGDVFFGPNAYSVDEINYHIDDSHKNSFLNHIKKYMDIKSDDIWPDFCGIRPKLQAKGMSFEDFYINNELTSGAKNFINLLGIDSPGLTSSLSIAEYVESIIIS
jgi:L-2-hydroxyglutarate oxidase LhgO